MPEQEKRHGMSDGELGGGDSRESHAPDPTLFGRVLRGCRAEVNMTIRELADRSKVSASYISSMERDRKHIPTPEIVDKLAKALGADAFQRDIFHRAASDPSLWFLPGLDFVVERAVQYQSRQRVREVYVVGEDVAELHDPDVSKVVSSNIIERGIAYYYCLKDREQCRSIWNQLKRQIKSERLSEKVSCIVASNRFLFNPGFAIIVQERPRDFIGLYAKWYKGAPVRVYQMEEAVATQNHRMLQTAHENLKHEASYDSDQLGTVSRVFPDQPMIRSPN